MAQFAVLMLAMQQALLAMRVLPEAELIWLALPFALAALGYPRLRWLGAGVLAILAQWSLATDQNRPVALVSAANHPARVIAEVGALMFHANENGVRLLETARTAHEYHWNKTR